MHSCSPFSLSLLVIIEGRVQASASREGSASFWMRCLCHSMLLRLYFRYSASITPYFAPPTHPLSAALLGAPILLERCICRERARAEASESRYIRLRGRARQAETWRTESRYYGRRIRVSAARPLVDRPIYRSALALRERRPKLADRVWCLGRVNGPTAIGIRARLIID